MPESVEDLKKLSPDERIRRLKELEEERKKEIEQAEELIKESVREIEDAEEKKKIPIPQARATELSALTTTEEKQVVAIHHQLGTEQLPTVAAPQQPKSLEEVAEEEARAQPRTEQQQHDLLQKGQSKFQKSEYALGTEQQRSAFGEYLSKSQQTVTGSSMGPDSGQLEKIAEVYKERSVTGAEAGDAQQKYFGTHQQVTGGYELRKREEEDKKTQSDSYRKRGGPA